MQPTYLPWPGYFALIKAVDHFVFLDDVNYSKRSWHSRNRICLNKKPHWISLPVDHNSGPLLNQIKLKQHIPWPNKHTQMLRSNYSKYPHFQSLKPILNTLVQPQSDQLVDITIPLIRLILKKLGIMTRLHLSSNLGILADRTERLIQICRNLNCDTYLSPIGSKEYLDADGNFNDSDINLLYHSYQNISYFQKGCENFISHLSIIDQVANIGWQETFNLL